jgi:4-hydroxy-tetrahydrodipicolinate synthase
MDRSGYRPQVSVPRGAPVGVMSITPFTSGGEVDRQALVDHLGRLVCHRVDIYMCSQGSGEGLGLSLDEKRLVYTTAAEVAGGRRHVVGAGIGLTGDTQTAVEQVEVLSATGVDAIQVFPPRTGARRPRDHEIEAYVAEMVAASQCPVILGDNVTLVGYGLGGNLIDRLLDRHPEIIGLSWTAPGAMVDLVDRHHLRVEVRTGWLAQMANAAALGAAGILCFDANVLPGLVCATWQALAAGSPDGPELLGFLLRVNALLSRHGNPASIKAVLAHTGRPAGNLRRPLMDLPEPERAALCEEWDALFAGRGMPGWF